MKVSIVEVPPVPVKPELKVSITDLTIEQAAIIMVAVNRCRGTNERGHKWSNLADNLQMAIWQQFRNNGLNYDTISRTMFTCEGELKLTGV